MTRDVAAARTFLFVPGDRPDRFAKAAASGADIAILDLEDAVSPDRRREAREHVRGWLDHAVMVPKAEGPGRLESGSRHLPAGTGRVRCPLLELSERELDRVAINLKV